MIVATSLATATRTPSLDLLSFPYVFRGALDVQATRITDGMMLAAARALAELAREEVVEEVSRAYGGERFSFGPEYLLPKPIDPRILVRESAAVAPQAAVERSRAPPLEMPRPTRRASPSVSEPAARRCGADRQGPPGAARVVFPEGTSETILRACRILAGRRDRAPDPPRAARDEIRAAIERLGLDAGRGPRSSIRRAARGSRPTWTSTSGCGAAAASCAPPPRSASATADIFGALMLRGGDADMMISGVSAHYVDSLRTILEVIGTAPGVRRISSHYMVLLPEGRLLPRRLRGEHRAGRRGPRRDRAADRRARRAPSASSRASPCSRSPTSAASTTRCTRKVRRATELVKEQAPDLVVDGEMQLATALDGAVCATSTSRSPSSRRTPTSSSSPTCSPATSPCTCSSTWGRRAGRPGPDGHAAARRT